MLKELLPVEKKRPWLEAIKLWMGNLISKGIHLVKAGNHPDANITTAAIMRRGEYKCWKCTDIGNAFEIKKLATYISVSSIAQLCLTLVTPWTAAHQASLIYIWLLSPNSHLVNINQKSTIDIHTQKRKSNPNTTLKIGIKLQENKREREEKKKPTKINPKQLTKWQQEHPNQ